MTLRDTFFWVFKKNYFEKNKDFIGVVIKLFEEIINPKLNTSFKDSGTRFVMIKRI